MKKILAIDIGGTSSRFAIFESSGINDLVLLYKFSSKTSDFDSLNDLLLEYDKQSVLDHKIGRQDIIIFAVPGPVESGTYSDLANVKWSVNIRPLITKYKGKEIFLINDFTAQAFGCLTDAVLTAKKIQEGIVNDKATIAVIGAGTGLGHCALKPDGHGGYLSFPSEAGHTAFPFKNDKEIKFQKFLQKETGFSYATNDMVVSGRGFSFLHKFLTGNDLSPEEISKVISSNSDTLIWFSRFYARACRNYALSVLPFGGMFVSGGIAAKLPYLIDNNIFCEEFNNSDTKHKLLKSFSILLNKNQLIGLWGAALYGLYNTKVK